MIEYAPVSRVFMSYEEAVLYCQFLEYRGHRDWRLPTEDEYRNITTLAGWYFDRVDWIKSKSPRTMVVSPVRTV